MEKVCPASGWSCLPVPPFRETMATDGRSRSALVRGDDQFAFAPLGPPGPGFDHPEREGTNRLAHPPRGRLDLHRPPHPYRWRNPARCGEVLGAGRAAVWLSGRDRALPVRPKCGSGRALRRGECRLGKRSPPTRRSPGWGAPPWLSCAVGVRPTGGGSGATIAGGPAGNRRRRWANPGRGPPSEGARDRTGDKALLPARRARSLSQAAVRAAWAPARARRGRIPGSLWGAGRGCPDPLAAASRRRRPGWRGAPARAARRWPRPAGRAGPAEPVGVSGDDRRWPAVTGRGSAPRRHEAPARGGPGRTTVAARWRIRAAPLDGCAGWARPEDGAGGIWSRSIRCRAGSRAWPRHRRESSGGRWTPPRVTSPAPAGTGHRRWEGDGREEPAAEPPPGAWPEEPPESRRCRAAVPRIPAVPSGQADPAAGSRAPRCRRHFAGGVHLASGRTTGVVRPPLPLLARSTLSRCTSRGRKSTGMEGREARRRD